MDPEQMKVKEEAYVYPLHFTLKDPATEAAILAKLPAHGAFGSKKRRREELKGTRSCYDWANTGACSYGSACRYSHDAEIKPDAGNPGRETLRAMAQEREHLFVTGGGGGGGGGGEEGGAVEEGGGGGAEAVISAEAALVGPQVTGLSAVLRYYTRLFAPGTGVGASSPGWDNYVHLQANKCCVVGLAPAHPLLMNASPVVSIALAPALAAGVQLHGKRKKGARGVEAETVLATAQTQDGRSWPLRAGMRGSLVEFNARLLAHPALLLKKPATQGHLAILLTDLKRVSEVIKGLLAEKDYAELCRARGLPSP